MWLSHERLDYNYRMAELSAALGVAPMSCIEEIIGKRERVAAMYAERLASVPGLRLPVAVACGARGDADELVRVCDPGQRRRAQHGRARRRAQVPRAPVRRAQPHDAALGGAQRIPGSGFLATARHGGTRAGRIGRGEGTPPHFGTIRLQPFYRAEFGSKDGAFPVTELAGRTSIAVPFPQPCRTTLSPTPRTRARTSSAPAWEEQ